MGLHILIVVLVLKSLKTYDIFYTNISISKNLSNQNNPKYYIKLLNETWSLKLYLFGHYYERIYPNIILNKHSLTLKINSYGTLLRDSKSLFLGYFHVNEEKRLEGIVEMNNLIYIFTLFYNSTILILVEKNEKVILPIVIKRRDFQKYFQDQNLKNENVCYMKVIVGPFMYQSISKNFHYRNHRQKLGVIKNYLDTVFKYLNEIYMKLPIEIKILFLIKYLYILTPQVCDKKFKGVRWLISIKEFCNETSTIDEILNNLESNIYDNMYCLTVAVIHHEHIRETLGYTYMRSMCKFFIHHRIIFINIVENHFIFNPNSTSVAFAHEIAHTMGAKHDEDTTCNINNDDYIMKSYYYHPRAEFSNCSIKDMSNHMSEYNARECFSDKIKKSLCGNGILEEMEQCDCGLQTHCPCCNKACHLISTAKCSPFGVDGVCCDSVNCNWKSRKLNITCQLDSECSMKKFCDGKVGCKSDYVMKMKTFCAGKSKLCADGYCKDSVCSLWNMEEYPSYKVSNESCLINCYENKSGNYHSILRLPPHPILILMNLSEIVYQIGSPCMDDEKFCDANGKCVSLEGSISGNIDIYLLMNPIFYAKLCQSFSDNYIYMILLFILLSVLLIGCLEIPYLTDRTNIYHWLFYHLHNSKPLVDNLNYKKFKLFVSIGEIRMNFSKSEIRRVLDEFLILQEIQICYDYLQRKKVCYPIKGRLVQLQDDSILNELKKKLS